MTNQEVSRSAGASGWRSARREPLPDCVVVHSSDVHVDDDYTASLHDGDGCWQLRRVVEAARRAGSQALLLVGDTFDHNRLASRIVERAAEILSAFPGLVVIMPGNHDPATEECVYLHPTFGELRHVQVLGVSCGDSLFLPNFGLEIWGRPHLSFGDMAPLADVPPRRARRRIVLAHGHYEPAPQRNAWPRPYWLFGDADLAATDADYVALGHWNRSVAVGPGPAPAWYSGSPDYAETINVLRFSGAGLEVERRPLDEAPSSAAEA